MELVEHIPVLVSYNCLLDALCIVRICQSDDTSSLDLSVILFLLAVLRGAATEKTLLSVSWNLNGIGRVHGVMKKLVSIEGVTKF